MFLFQTNRLPRELLASTPSRHLYRGEYLYRQGETVQAVFAVVCGRVQLCTSTSEGRQVPLYTVGAGECVAEAALFAENYCSDVVSETESHVRAFPKRELRQTLLQNPDLAEEFMTLQAKRCHRLRTQLELRSLRSARERILQFLKMSALPNTSSITLDRPLKNMADDLGLTHESFYRTLKTLMDDGMVRRTGRLLELAVQTGDSTIELTKMATRIAPARPTPPASKKALVKTPVA